MASIPIESAKRPLLCHLNHNPWDSYEGEHVEPGPAHGAEPAVRRESSSGREGPAHFEDETSASRADLHPTSDGAASAGGEDAPAASAAAVGPLFGEWIGESMSGMSGRRAATWPGWSPAVPAGRLEPGEALGLLTLPDLTVLPDGVI